MKYNIGDYVITTDNYIDGLCFIKSRIIGKDYREKKYKVKDLWLYNIQHDEIEKKIPVYISLMDEAIIDKVPKNFVPKQLKDCFPEYFI
jgi:hypothetical protein